MILQIQCGVLRAFFFVWAQALTARMPESGCSCGSAGGGVSSPARALHAVHNGVLLYRLCSNCVYSAIQAWNQRSALLQDYAVLTLAYQGLAVVVAKSVKLAKSEWLTRVVESIASSAAKGDDSPLWRLVRRLTGKYATPVACALRDADGLLTTTTV